jgi:hypothetical protein
VARVVSYADVLQAARAIGLRCVYPHGAAFAPVSGDWAVVGWVTGDDATVRPAFRDRTRTVDRRALPRRIGEEFARIGGEAWVAPVHHWAAELDHGESRSAVEAALTLVAVDPTPLAGRREADAIALDAPAALADLVDGLLDAMSKSDFCVLFPGSPVLLTLHHHRQAWWRCRSTADADALLKG